MRFLIIALALMSMACMESAAVIAPTHGTESTPTAISSRTPTPERTETPESATICGDWNIRSGASDAGPSFGWLYDGDTVTVLQARGGWVRVGNGRWVREDALCAK